MLFVIEFPNIRLLFDELAKIIPEAILFVIIFSEIYCLNFKYEFKRKHCVSCQEEEECTITEMRNGKCPEWTKTRIKMIKENLEEVNNKLDEMG